MKRICMGAMAVILLCSVILPGLAEENWDEFFRCVEGQISFTLPNVPTVYHEPDLPAQEVRENTDVYNGWTDKIQLTGYTPETVTLGRMRITFPCAPDLYSEEGAAFADVFSADYVYLRIYGGGYEPDARQYGYGYRPAAYGRIGSPGL